MRKQFILQIILSGPYEKPGTVMTMILHQQIPIQKLFLFGDDLTRQQSFSLSTFLLFTYHETVSYATSQCWTKCIWLVFHWPLQTSKQSRETRSETSLLQPMETGRQIGAACNSSSTIDKVINAAIIHDQSNYNVDPPFIRAAWFVSVQTIDKSAPDVASYYAVLCGG